MDDKSIHDMDTEFALLKQAQEKCEENQDTRYGTLEKRVEKMEAWKDKFLAIAVLTLLGVIANIVVGIVLAYVKK